MVCPTSETMGCEPALHVAPLLATPCTFTRSMASRARCKCLMRFFFFTVLMPRGDRAVGLC